MVDTIKLNRAEHKILKCLYSNGCTSQYNSMTIAELLDMDKELSTKTVIYKNLKKLISANCVGTGIIDGHANTYYLLERAIKIIEGKEPDKITQQTENSTSISYDSNSVRNKLIEITNQGLMLKAIARNTGMDVNDLSRFKGGMECLKKSDVELLSEYLNAVVIPQWNSVIPGKVAKEVGISECDVCFGMPVMESASLSADKPKGILALEKLKAKRISKV